MHPTNDRTNHRNGRSLKLWLVVPLLCLASCANPANWPPEQVAKDVQTQWAKFDVTEVSLKSTADGFEGTGKSSSGETFKIKLTKDAAQKSVKGSGIGDRGTELDYSLQIK